MNKPIISKMYEEKLYRTSVQEVDDIEYWKQIKRGERAGLEALYLKYTQELFRLGMSIKSDRSLVKDCIQEVFFKIWEYRNTVKTTDNVKLYLFKCLSNKIHKEVGKEKKRYVFFNLELKDRLYSETEADKDINNVKESKNLALMKSIKALSSRQREVIHLLYYENHSYEDTSIIMGINVQSVYTLAWKAIANLKKSLNIVAWVSLIYLPYFLSI
ncbi:MAG: RNA polymerase sigma factor [Cytophagales bacterium]|uniref:RNA polymerase sigma factor n=1 Tax=Cyclobacterium marinum TaxID=104 RepID=UPI0030D80B43|nr:RNA polymerase sigma factor [Cytophagales bacterium]